MGRNNPKNIKTHNDKLHKEQAKAKAKKNARANQILLNNIAAVYFNFLLFR